jgi:NADH-quinone oxidoreductase subunit I
MVSRRGIGLPGILKGLATTARTAFKPTHTAEYPDVAPDLPPRSRGVIALLEENCTSCMLCARECPDWCIYIDSHKETIPATTEGGRDRQRNVLDRFAIDFSLCMYCGICIEVCPFDALHWSPQFEYAEVDLLDLLHEKDRLGGWMASVPPPPALDEKSAEPAEIAAANKPARGTGLVGGAGPGAAGAGGPGARMPRTVRPRPAGAGPARGAAAPTEVVPTGEPAAATTPEPTRALPVADPTEALPAGVPTAAPAEGEPTEALPTGTVPPPAKEPLTGTPESVPDDTSPTPPPADDAT